MAGAGLIIIKRRIKSITNTKKITNAMGLIATSNLRKSRQNLEANKAYYEAFNDVINKIVSSSSKSNLYVAGNKSDKKLYIALTSDSGLCGGFNGAVVTAADNVMRGDKDKSLLITVGQKGISYFKRLKYETLSEYVDIPNEPGLKEAKEIADRALSLYEKGEIGEVHVIYTQFLSTVNQKVEVKKVLPIEPKKMEKVSVAEFEPDAEIILEKAIRLHIEQQLFNLLLNSKASEQASRMSSMDSATKNANDLLDALNIKYNRIRQSAITQEITEIVGGAEALK
ncbi:F-type H+-transporting ATPase subunit gamma [Clostridium acetobutylicum]|jgi:F-type H+-transporting ATPase subunit gamma|uniref:ATP synthase gamma chain n=1 Tax=Clostridium acetobutylicum (strain ATCC 824 / DSM 792 / JCM 1419 / IAM 19013 / LMG 5710 / NBRC 13948 / NRRL B-527 / VKM B-1787 / 2291 / W) TaxID=272562 RepID=ATPG_CLOAB|nr:MULTISPECIES: ATP synthase F1 subunit gamma [Clostridium]Q9Z688.1 RecName: Full=ATP synthase gamma chain; AltName: Full=ATP synthase F1 sector gamma subunit; AltName: Full=F-ATPase gamma subunit [Clostridium acetobutylicum ATCC 824]AAD16425.1 ATP synthase subunit gamma [Clostridium acetobutylicum ATCC 824]AAK80809.1 FoF1-type ATP synthase gamma subunit [Clostridium acetobutylicum ATCC 824]ADZ21910.1 F0F1 ATP synthase subunit gamma [Clostridium acetobutylicum EA 2018]AEI34239.1 F0F1 ATP synt